MLGSRYVRLISVQQSGTRGLRDVKIAVGLVNLIVVLLEVYYWVLYKVSARFSQVDVHAGFVVAVAHPEPGWRGTGWILEETLSQQNTKNTGILLEPERCAGELWTFSTSRIWAWRGASPLGSILGGGIGSQLVFDLEK